MMTMTFSDEQVRSAAVECETEVRALIDAEPAGQRVAVAALASKLAEELDETNDSGRHTYRQYLADKFADMDADAILDVVAWPDSYVVTGYAGVVEALVSEVADLNPVDRWDWERDMDERARDAAVQAKIDQARGK